ncbi:hypothetical protein L6164_017052 [Bauhinia variegata]|uniref:Uncharacterized protein n=1 Tax=Bauhinia variegata TaxID=167791 RepID=A0ACB9N880_BAUVA|nr:hypothetical protein L6164_017052 [Bauhinia variegata]
MEVEGQGRRIRRSGIQRRDLSQTQNLLPLHASTSNSINLSKTISCWYCDFKISCFNKSLFYFGRRHARFFKVWFSIGTGFALSALLGVTLILLWELAQALHLLGDNDELGNIAHALFFGFSPLQSSLSLSLADAGCICISTIVSVFVHEFGHAIAAASEGIQIEYVAIFIAVLFPGALVAFDYELLQSSPPLTALRVYSAGIWHNAVCCAACALALFLLPLVLFPFYTHDHGPMVLDVPSTSPLSGYLSPGDVIVSVDGIPIRNAQEWMEVNTLTYNMKLSKNVNISHHTGDLRAVNGRKGYCVPSFIMEERRPTEVAENQYTCPNDLIAFVKVFLSTAGMLDNVQSETDLLNRDWNIYCLNAKDVVEHNKCGDGWGIATKYPRSGTTCSQDEYCLAPVQEPGLVWIEIKYSSPSSHECSLLHRNRFPGPETSNLKEAKCGGTFIFVGDVISMAHSVHFTSYQPRWGLLSFAYFPNLLERILIWTFRVSVALALLNSLPVYFLDGGSVLDAALSHFTSLSPRKREKFLKSCLFGGTIISIIGLFWELL